MTGNMPGVTVRADEHEPRSRAMAQNALFFECYDTAPQALKDHFVALLIGRVYRDAPWSMRQRIVDHLLRPLGLLSLTALAGGAFARMRLRPQSGGEPGGLAALQAIRSADVVDLVSFVQQVSADCVDSLAGLLGSQPGAMTAASVLVLLAILQQRQAVAPLTTMSQ